MRRDGRLPACPACPFHTLWLASVVDRLFHSTMNAYNSLQTHWRSRSNKKVVSTYNTATSMS